MGIDKFNSEFEKFLDFKLLNSGLGLGKQDKLGKSEPKLEQKTKVGGREPALSSFSPKTQQRTRYPKPIGWGYSAPDLNQTPKENKNEIVKKNQSSNFDFKIDEEEFFRYAGFSEAALNLGNEYDLPKIKQNTSINSKRKAVSASNSNAGMTKRVFAMAFDLFLLASIFSLLLTVGLKANKISFNTISIYNSETTTSLTLLFVAIYFSYFLLFEGFWQQSVGKRIFGLRIENANPFTIILRTVGFIFSLIPAGLGLFWCVLDEKKRAWHDVISGIEVKNN